MLSETRARRLELTKAMLPAASRIGVLAIRHRLPGVFTLRGYGFADEVIS